MKKSKKKYTMKNRNKYNSKSKKKINIKLNKKYTFINNKKYTIKKQRGGGESFFEKLKIYLEKNFKPYCDEESKFDIKLKKKDLGVQLI